MLPGWVFVLSHGRILHVNAPLCAWLGYAGPSALQGAPGSALLARPALNEPASQGRLLLGLLRADGTTAHLEAACVEIDTESGAAQLFWIPGQNAELPGRPRRATQIASLAAGLAHELNNPLTYVSLNAGFVARELAFLEQDPGGSPEATQAAVARASEALRVAREGVERLSAIVRDLRAFSRADEGVGAVDVRRSLELALALTRNTLRHKARLQLELDDTDDIEANESQLGQALISLFLLALHGIPDGGAGGYSLVLRLSQPGEGEVVLRVEMTSEGAPLPFPEADPDLIASKKALASFGARLDVDPSGLSMRFRVASAAAPAPPAPTSRPVGLRVLVVDDEPTIAAALRRLLDAEATISSVTSGREAIEVLLHDQRFDVIFCDVMMPEIGGMDVYEAVRRARPGVESRIVFMTGGAFTHRTREFLRAVPNRTIDKPIDPELLLHILHGTRPG